MHKKRLLSVIAIISFSTGYAIGCSQAPKTPQEGLVLIQESCRVYEAVAKPDPKVAEACAGLLALKSVQ